ncbi:MAG: hypothetical protein VX335_05405 [Pseudomonadota bacterium]|nr:hypothetical protein [Pseudomonadota bacterium]
MRFYKVIQRIRDAEFKGVKLIGPSVIDFEYSNSVRSLFNLYKVKYNAISSLLYVDRRGSPYNKQLFFFDTKNKVKLLYAISKLSRKSSDDIYISEVNWPLLSKGKYSPILYGYKVSALKSFYKNRVKPLLGASEETSVSEEVYAKYMLDYHEIVKNTKAVKRLYWHQLIAPGYGLVDDSGDTLRKMPAFYVYKKFIKDNS